MEEKDIKRIFEVFKGPFEYHEQSWAIWDSELEMVVSIRGWSYLSKFPDGAEIQDNVGKFITNCLNKEYHEQNEIKSTK